MYSDPSLHFVSLWMTRVGEDEEEKNSALINSKDLCGALFIALQPRKRRFTADNPSFSLRQQRYGARNGMSSVWGRYFERLQDLRLAVFGYSGIQLFAWAGGGENNPLVIIIFKYYYYKKFSSPSTSRFVLLNT